MRLAQMTEFLAQVVSERNPGLPWPVTTAPASNGSRQKSNDEAAAMAPINRNEIMKLLGPICPPSRHSRVRCKDSAPTATPKLKDSCWAMLEKLVAWPS